jgi:CYTH domain-containing protein
MGTEIERKFLVTSGYEPQGPGTPMVQGYLSHAPELTIRIRRAGESYFLTIKGPTQGISRSEYEYELPPSDGPELLCLCSSDLVEKVRYKERVGDHFFEVDVFSGKNSGLVVAEVELSREDEAFQRPPWLGEEVSRDPRFTNSALSRRPFCEWAVSERPTFA